MKPISQNPVLVQQQSEQSVGEICVWDLQSAKSALRAIQESIQSLQAQLDCIVSTQSETVIPIERAISQREDYWRRNGYWIVD